jgi:hypothetical protein
VLKGRLSGETPVAQMGHGELGVAHRGQRGGVDRRSVHVAALEAQVLADAVAGWTAVGRALLVPVALVILSIAQRRAPGAVGPSGVGACRLK